MIADTEGVIEAENRPVRVSRAVQGRYEGFVYFIHRTSKRPQRSAPVSRLFLELSWKATEDMFEGDPTVPC